MRAGRNVVEHEPRTDEARLDLAHYPCAAAAKHDPVTGAILAAGANESGCRDLRRPASNFVPQRQRSGMGMLKQATRLIEPPRVVQMVERADEGESLFVGPLTEVEGRVVGGNLPCFADALGCRWAVVVGALAVKEI